MVKRRRYRFSGVAPMFMSTYRDVCAWGTL